MLPNATIIFVKFDKQKPWGLDPARFINQLEYFTMLN